MSKMNAVGWFDIYVNDLDRAVAFYEAVLGQKLEELKDPTGQTKMMSFPADMSAYGATEIHTPNMDACGDDMITYEVCDANGCDEAIVSISVACPTTYPMATVAEVTGVNDQGVAISEGESVELQGIVHGADFRGGSGLQFSLIDGTGGIALFSFDIEYYESAEGDELIVRGSIGQFNGLTQINPDTIILVSTGNALNTPMVVTELNEDDVIDAIKLAESIIELIDGLDPKSEYLDYSESVTMWFSGEQSLW